MLMIYKRDTSQSGYVGILMILIGTALTIFLMMKVYFTPSTAVSEFQPTNESGVIPTTQYERLQTDVDAANAVVEQQNAKNAETNKMINSL